MEKSVRHKGPLFTLLAGVVLGAVLLSLAMTAAARDTAKRNAAVAAPASPSVSPPASAAPSPLAAAPAVTYAGRVTGSHATVAIAVHGGHAIAYLCDGKRIEAWLKGTAVAGKLALTGAGAARLTGTYGHLATGAVQAGSRRWTFAVAVATAPSGLYRAATKVRNAKIVAGWIVLADGTQVGILTTDGRPATAPRLDTGSRTASVNGTPVTAEAVDAASTSGF